MNKLDDNVTQYINQTIREVKIMRKIAFIILILGVFGILIAQDLQKQAFDDFGKFTNDFDNVQNQVVRVHSLIVEIEDLKSEILDDVDRKKAFKALIDLHPDYDLVEIQQIITKLGTLKTWLENNDFVTIEE